MPDNLELAWHVINMGIEKGITIACAESCTGGLIAGALTSIPGSSETFLGGVTSYAVSVKERVLGVDPSIIEEFGVVSTQTAEAMAERARELIGADIAVSTTGIAGPGGAEPGKPVGTVCFGLSTVDGATNEVTCRGESREEVRELAVHTALSMLQDAIEMI